MSLLELVQTIAQMKAVLNAPERPREQRRAARSEEIL
jgi:hypothetical protein